MPFPPEMQMQGTKMGQGGMILPNGTDIRDVTILSKTEWNRIQQELHKRQIQEERMRRMREEKENRKQMSKEMVQHWGNTIAVSFFFSLNIQVFHSNLPIRQILIVRWCCVYKYQVIIRCWDNISSFLRWNIIFLNMSPLYLLWILVINDIFTNECSLLYNTYKLF